MITWQKTDDSARARAEALFRRRERRNSSESSAMAEYRAAQEAAFARMQELRRLRLARKAGEAVRR
jgi:hypothetical protein